MPYFRRMPKFGFTNPTRVEYKGINLDAIQTLADAKGLKTIDPSVLYANGLIAKTSVTNYDRPHANPRRTIIFSAPYDASPLAVERAALEALRDTPGVEIVRALPVFGYQDQEGHCEIQFTDVRVPVANLLGTEGSGFALAQARLGPGRIHHCMRCIGAAERALELMCQRVTDRVAFGRPLSEQGVIREWIADSRMEIEQARLLTLKAAYLMDTVGNKGAAVEISAIKVVVPNMALKVIDRAIQAHGGGGVSDDFPLAAMYAGIRTLRLADGPDEVHRRQVAKRELGRYVPTEIPPDVGRV